MTAFTFTAWNAVFIHLCVWVFPRTSELDVDLQFHASLCIYINQIKFYVMRKLFLSLVALMVATVSFAQNTLVATLSHESDIQMFYGSSALANAVDAAVSGDVITLSGGTFKSAKIDLTKGITIRGAGAEAEAPTIIDCYGLNISIPATGNNSVVIEGAIIKLSNYNSIYKADFVISSGNLYVIKCIVQTKTVFGTSSTSDAKFVDCDMSGSITLNGASNVKFSNCKVRDFSNNSNANPKFFNCYLLGGSYSNSSFVNCILSQKDWIEYSGSVLPANASAMNCLFISYSLQGTTIDCYQATVPEVFASYEYKEVDPRYGTYRNVPTTDKLSEEAKTKYLGTDGKEVGLYGGQYPYDLTPSYPQITKLNVAKQATADNKLSVEIEVSATE